MRRSAILAAVAVIAVVSYARSQQSDVEVQKVGENSYRLVLKSFRSNSVAAAQQELFPEATRICASRSVRFGRYEFEQREAIQPGAKTLPFVLKQEIHCGDATGAPTTTSIPDPNWHPTADQQQQIQAITYSYFQLKDTGNYEQARALLSDANPFVQWRSSAEKFNSQAGEVRSRKIKKITWYKDPPQAPAAGIYAAVDFVSQFANIDIHCGYVVWHQGQDGSFRLMREEQNFIDKSMQQKLEPSVLVGMRAKFGC